MQAFVGTKINIIQQPWPFVSSVVDQNVEASTTRGTTALVCCLINSSLYTGTVHRWWSTPNWLDGHQGCSQLSTRNYLSLIRGQIWFFRKFWIRFFQTYLKVYIHFKSLKVVAKVLILTFWLIYLHANITYNYTYNFS
jgi:hypothetical protein